MRKNNKYTFNKIKLMLLFLVASFFAYISYGIYQFKNVEFNISTDEDKIIIEKQKIVII